MIKEQLCRKKTSHETKFNQINSPSQQSSLVPPRNIDFSDDISIKDPTINSRLSYGSLPYQLSICSPTPKKSPELNLQFIEKQVLIPKQYEIQPAQLLRPFLSSLDMDFQHSDDSNEFSQIQQFSLPFHGFQIVMFLTIYFYLPLQISFDLVNINYGYIVIILLDAMIQLKTQFYSQGKLITDFPTIKQQYQNQNLRNDILIIVSFIFLLLLKGKTQWIFVLLIYFGSNSRLSQMIQQFQIYYFTKIPNLMFIIFRLVLLFHYLTCFWVSNQNEMIFEQEDPNTYINSLYFTIGMLTMNNGYTPRDTEQIIFLSLTQIVGGFIFVYLIVEIFCFLNQYQQQQFEYEQMNSKMLDFQEILRITSINGKKSAIQREIKSSIKRKLLASCFKTSNLEQLIEISEEIKCQPQEVIVTENQYDDGSIYLIYEGSFSVSIKQCKICQFEQFEQFGQISFYTQFPRTATITSDSEGILFKINRQKYLRCLSHNEKELQDIHAIHRYFLRKDEILFQNKLQMKCLCCHSSQHLIKNCQQLFYYPKITEIPDDHQNQERIMWRRRKRGVCNHYPVMNEREIGFLHRLIKEEPLASCNSIDSSEWNCSHTLQELQEKMHIQKIGTIDEDRRETLPQILHTFTRGAIQKHTLVKNKLNSPTIPIKFQSLSDSDVIFSQQQQHSPLHIVQKELTNFEGQFHFKLFHPEFNLIEVIKRYKKQYI